MTAFRGSVYDLSTHPYGCRVLQRCFEYMPEDQTRPLLDELHKYVPNLMIDQFGVSCSQFRGETIPYDVWQNYVVQFVLEHGRPQDRAMIISKLTGQMYNMAKHKFASNVCEKALVCADPESRRQLIDEIMTPKQDGLSPIMGLMKDSFGSKHTFTMCRVQLLTSTLADYVLQRALTVADADQKELLISKVRPHLVNMRRYSSAYSKHLSASTYTCGIVTTCLTNNRRSVERLIEKCSSTDGTQPEAVEPSS